MFTRCESLPLCLAAAGLLTGCSSGAGPGNAPPDPGRGRVLHASTAHASQSIDARAGAETAATNLAFGALGPSFKLEPGTPQVLITETGTASEILSAPVVGTTIPSADQLLIFANLAATGSAQQVVNAGRLNLDAGSIPLTGQARLYFANAVPQSPAGGVDFSFVINNGAFESPPAIQHIGYPNMSPEVLVPVAPGDTFRFGVNIGQGAETLTSVAVPLTGRKVYLVALSGNTAASTLQPGLAFRLFQLN